MERTDKAKIVLVILLVLLLARLILGFFPVPLEFSPYTGAGEASALQETDVKEIRYCFGAERLKNVPLYFHRIVTADGADGVLISTTKYRTETLEEPVHVTGITTRMPKDPEEERTKQQNWSKLVFEKEYLLECGSEAAAYEPFGNALALDLTFSDTTEDNPACLWVSIAAFAAFCCLLALLLAEYVSRKDAGKRKPTD